MKLKNLIKIATLAICLPVFITACKKEIASKQAGVNSSNGSGLAVSGLTFSSEEMNHVGLVLSTNLSADLTALDPGGSCPPITTYNPGPDVYPRTVTIDWGTGCTSGDITRSGKMIVEYTGDLELDGSQSTTSYDNFYMNGTKFEGKLKFSNNGDMSMGQKVYRLTYKNRKLTYENGDYNSVNGHARVVKRSDGIGFPGFPDGNFKETTTEGLPLTYTTSVGGTVSQYSVAITAALIYKEGCAWITKGATEYTFGDQSTATLDYGTGSCDDQAEYTRDGVTSVITLRPR